MVRLAGRLIAVGWLDDRVTMIPVGGATLEMSAVQVVEVPEANAAAAQVKDSSCVAPCSVSVKPCEVPL